MSVVAFRRERCVAGQAAEDEQTRIASSHQRQTEFDAHGKSPTRRTVKTSDLRVALFSGNYNYVRDGANQALNRLVGYLLREGAQVRIYSSPFPEPAFEPTGDLVSLPSIAIPGRPEYRLGLGLSASARRDLAQFLPNVVHISAPDIIGHRAVSWARARQVPAVASVHTRFETYLAYYRLQWL